MEVQRASTCPRCARVFIEGERLCPFDAARLQEQSIDKSDALIGTVLDSSYVVLSKLGEGGMGVVYRALQQRLDRQVALKVLGPRFGGDLKASERFRSEARAVSQLTNPHTVTVYDFGTTEDGTLYLAMQLLKGESLRERMKRLPLTPLEAVKIAADICDSLAEAHERTPHIIHRDIKPDNIFVRVTEAGALFATVLDFGLARIADSPGLTASNSVIGTVAYMAPEQAQSRKDVDGRLDLYALGVMLFEMLAGKVPFDSQDKLGVMYKHVYNAPPRLRDARAAAGLGPVPASLDDLVDALLAKAPAQRPPSARAVRGRLLEIEQELGGAPAKLPLPSSSEHPSDGEISEDDEPTLVRRPPSAPDENTEPDTDPDPGVQRKPRPLPAAPPADTGTKQFPSRAPASKTPPKPDDVPTAILPRLQDQATPRPELHSTSAILESAGLGKASPNRLPAIAAGVAVLIAAIASALFLSSKEPQARPANPAPTAAAAPPVAAPIAAPSVPAPAPPGAIAAPESTATANAPAPGTAMHATEKPASARRVKKPAGPKKGPDLDDQMREYLHDPK